MAVAQVGRDEEPFTPVRANVDLSREVLDATRTERSASRPEKVTNVSMFVRRAREERTRTTTQQFHQVNNSYFLCWSDRYFFRMRPSSGRG